MPASHASPRSGYGRELATSPRGGLRTGGSAESRPEPLGHLGDGPFGDDVDEFAVDLELAAEHGAQGGRRRHPARPPLLRLGDEGDVHGHETAPDMYQAGFASARRSISSGLSASPPTVNSYLKSTRDPRSNPLSVTAAGVGVRTARRLSPPTSSSLGQNTEMPALLSPPGAVEDQVGEQVVVELQRVRDPLAEEGTYRLPGSGAPPQRQEQVPLSFRAEAGEHGRRHGEQVGRVHDEARVGGAGIRSTPLASDSISYTQLDAQGQLAPPSRPPDASTNHPCSSVAGVGSMPRTSPTASRFRRRRPRQSVGEPSHAAVMRNAGEWTRSGDIDVEHNHVCRKAAWPSRAARGGCGPPGRAGRPARRPARSG